MPMLMVQDRAGQIQVFGRKPIFIRDGGFAAGLTSLGLCATDGDGVCPDMAGGGRGTIAHAAEHLMRWRRP